MSVVKIAGLTKTYKSGLRQERVVALDRLDMDIEAGQIVGYLGHNGAGKTTTFKLLLGLLRPTAGDAWLLGKNVRDIRSRESVGFLPEQPYFYNHLTAREFLDFYCHLFKQAKSTRQQRVAELLDLVNLNEFANVQLRKFSRGMLQRVGVAQALINDPQLIFLDEPTSGLDPVGRKQMRDLLLRLKAEGKTVLYSTHILSDVEAVADQVAILSRGRLHAFGSLDKLLGAAEKRVEMKIEGLDATGKMHIKGLASEVLVEQDGQLLVHLSGEESIQTAQQIVSERNAELISMMPHRRMSESLEDLFVELVNGQSMIKELKKRQTSIENHEH